MKAIKLFLCLFISLFVFGCEEGTEYKYFEVKDESVLNQTVYVGDTQAPAPVEFTASGAWTSTVEYSTLDSATGRADVSSTGWITLDPSSGESAGNYSVKIYLDPDKGKNVYRAVISFICNGETLEVTLENNHSYNPGDSDDVNDPEKIEAAKEELSSGFLSSSIHEVFDQLDKDYSTPESRKLLSSSSKQLEELWYGAYDAINTCNLLLSAYDSDLVNEQDRNEIIANSRFYRALFHFYLASVFGDVPIQTEYPLILKPSRVSIDQVMDFVMTEMEESIQLLPKYDWNYLESRFVRILASVMKNNSFAHPDIMDYLKSIVYDESDRFFDSNMDGIINSDDSPIMVQAYLLLAYAECENNNLNSSMELMNYLSAKLNDDNFRLEVAITPEIIKEKIRNILSSDWGAGIKYLVNRFMFDYNWDYSIYLPLPMKALDDNENLTQNAGWQ